MWRSSTGWSPATDAVASVGAGWTPEQRGVEAPAFVPLQVSETDAVGEKEPAQPVEIVAGGHIVIRLPADASGMRIAEIVAVLEVQR